MYQPIHPLRSSTLPLRRLTYHVNHWGPEQSPLPPLVLLHGWMDVGASYQFTVDALRQQRRILAPDWRGFGQTSTPQADHYVFADYLADLDMMLDHYAPGQAVDLVGHSMGGNVAMMYAGVRPERIRRLVNLEGFGMPATRPAQAPTRYAQWIDEIKQLHQGEKTLNTYDDASGVARRLMKTNPRLTQDKADWLAQHWARPNAQGRWEILGDPAHKVTSAQLFRVDEIWPCTPASPPRCWRWRPVTTAWASGGKSATAWTSTTSALPMCPTAAWPWCRTRATCCTTISPRPWHG